MQILFGLRQPLQEISMRSFKTALGPQLFSYWQGPHSANAFDKRWFSLFKAFSFSIAVFRAAYQLAERQEETNRKTKVTIFAEYSSGQDGARLCGWDYSLAPTRIPYIKFWCSLSHVVNPLLSKVVRSRWVSIGLVRFLPAYGFQLRLGPLTCINKNAANIQPSCLHALGLNFAIWNVKMES